MRKILFALFALLWMLAADGAIAESASPDAGRAYHGIALIGDPHLPGKHLKAKEALIQTINGWGDVDRAVVLGDICSETGTVAEYAAARQFFHHLNKPVRFVAGNHDYIYEDKPSTGERLVKGSKNTRKTKLERFAKTFGTDEVYGSERIGNYLLIYLSADHLESNYLTALSDDQINWLSSQLSGNNNTPTIIFFHAPLAGTVKPYNQYANTPSFIAQPAIRLYDLVRDNPQIFLWVAGHLHLPATNENYSAPMNLYEKQVMVIHNTDIERERPWTNVLQLYPEKVVVRTYDHGQGIWRSDLERTIRLPDLFARRR